MQAKRTKGLLPSSHAVPAQLGCPNGVPAVLPEGLTWTTRPHEPGEPARHVAELSELAGFAHTRANLWRYEPGARGRRHRHPLQEETFVPLSGTLTMYLGEPPERVEVPLGGLIHVEPSCLNRATPPRTCCLTTPRTD
jgi:quercetin dioxygenase-like cupin family protein